MIEQQELVAVLLVVGSYLGLRGLPLVVRFVGWLSGEISVGEDDTRRTRFREDTD